MSSQQAHELPMIGPDTHVYYNGDMFDNHNLPDDEFVRAIGVMTPPAFNTELPDLLRQTDRHLAHLAKMAGALVIPHQWGLYDARHRPSDERAYYHNNELERIGISPHHIVVATVPVIREVRHPQADRPVSNRIWEAIRAYKVATPGLRLLDLCSRQFVIGKLHPSTSERLILTDIDARWITDVAKS